MILAAEINKYATLDRYDLTSILARSGYMGMSFESVKFLGITDGGDFCYAVQYFDESGTGEVEVTKVYVKKSATGHITAEF